MPTDRDEAAADFADEMMRRWKGLALDMDGQVSRYDMRTIGQLIAMSYEARQRARGAR